MPSNLTDNNLPDSATNLGWKIWTGSLGSLEERVSRWEQWAISHLGTDYWNSRNEYPHPNQGVSVLNFFQGHGQLNDDGIFISQAAQPRGIRWVPSLDDPSALPFAYIVANDFSNTETLEMGVIHNGTDALVITSAIDSANAFVRLTASSAGGSPSAVLSAQPAINTFALSSATLALANVTSDFTGLGDGMLWYRSDTDAIRARIGGVTYDLLTSAYVPPVVPMTSLDLPYAATSSTPIGPGTTDCFIDIDATAGTRTVNLPSAVTVTSGFTYIIRKVDSTANTIVVDPNGAQTINGASTYTLTKQYETLTITSNGANWDIWGTYAQPSTTISTKTGAYTVVPQDKVVLCDTTAGAFTVTLPPVATSAGTTVTIKKVSSDANLLTIDGNSSETIDGVLNMGITTQYSFLTLSATAAAWFLTGMG